MSNPTPFERMSAGYAKNAPGQEAERKAELAQLFQPNERCEQLLQIRNTDPALFATFGPTVRMQVGMYQQQREAAEYEPEGDDAA